MTMDLKSFHGFYQRNLDSEELLVMKHLVLFIFFHVEGGISVSLLSTSIDMGKKWWWWHGLTYWPYLSG